MPKYSLSVSDESMRIIAAALNELPRRVVQPVFDEIGPQMEEQRDAVERAALREGSNVAGYRVPV